MNKHKSSADFLLVGTFFPWIDDMAGASTPTMHRTHPSCVGPSASLACIARTDKPSCTGPSCSSLIHPTPRSLCLYLSHHSLSRRHNQLARVLVLLPEPPAAGPLAGEPSATAGRPPASPSSAPPPHAPPPTRFAAAAFLRASTRFPLPHLPEQELRLPCFAPRPTPATSSSRMLGHAPAPSSSSGLR